MLNRDRHPCPVAHPLYHWSFTPLSTLVHCEVSASRLHSGSYSCSETVLHSPGLFAIFCLLIRHTTFLFHLLFLMLDLGSLSLRTPPVYLLCRGVPHPRVNVLWIFGPYLSKNLGR
jgi:hypothetical protein